MKKDSQNNQRLDYLMKEVYPKIKEFILSEEVIFILTSIEIIGLLIQFIL